MIATHNIKVNGRWYTVGEEIPEEKEQKVVEEPEVPKAEEKTEAAKPRTAARRKVSK